ncbi:magnesium transporter CorA family protein [Nigerium massiliense]|uniref:magnesium transporter CorA family protein n=1 Tax=Nigerium massiliense TaxID=1522317 RepID=UPI000A5B19A9|nr:magnesium transporter CorA family protein [Nigerium massiliense]
MTEHDTASALRLTSSVWREGSVIAQDVRADEIIELAHDPDSLIWVDLVSPTWDQLDPIVRGLGLPSSATEDALAPHERVKLTRHDEYLFFTVYGTDYTPAHADELFGTVRTSRVSGIVLPSALVTIRLDDGFDLDELRARWADADDLERHGAGTLVYNLLDMVVDQHFATIQSLDDAVEDLEESLFAQQRTGNTFQRQVYELRKNLVTLRRVVLPMRDVVNGLLRHQHVAGDDFQTLYEDLNDHVLRASEWTDSLRDLSSSLFETNLSLQDARLNIVMKKLSGWAAIIAVPTAITGWFGMNVPYPFFGQPAGFWLSAGLILAMSVGLYVTFKQRDWL